MSQLLSNKIRNELPALYSTEDIKNPIVKCKFFLPGTNWTWYVIKFDGNDIFYGYVVGLYSELGYFSLKELTSLKSKLGFKVELDLYFKSVPLSKLQN